MSKEDQVAFLKSRNKSPPIPPYEYSSQLLSPMRVVRIMMRIMARVVMMTVVTIITTKVVWIGVVIEVRVWVIIWFRIELPL
jgi:hypothetical protein